MARYLICLMAAAVVAAAGCSRAPERVAASPGPAPPEAAAAVEEPDETWESVTAAGESAHTIGETAAAAALAAKVKTLLLGQSGLSSGDLDVEATPEGEVTLKGSARAEEERQRIEEAVLQVEGVRSVRNDMTVTE